MSILTVFFSGFSTWGFHSHFIKVRSTTWGPIGKNVVYSSAPPHFLPYNNNTPFLCFPFLSGWYTYCRSHIRCGSYIFMIARRVINIKAFNVASKVRSLVSTWFGPLISLPFGFFTSNLSFHILGALMGSTSFVELFVVKAPHEDLRTIFSLPTFVDPQMTFTMFSLCYAQHLNYLLCIMFPFPSIF
jgi:hypothetical protein